MNLCIYDTAYAVHLLFELRKKRIDFYQFIDDSFPDYNYINGFSDNNCKEFLFRNGAEYL